MSFDEYVHHMRQKYRLAVAIAVIKGKPQELPIEQYLAQLREKLNNQMEIDDLDISIYSNDFNFDDDETNFITNEGFNGGEILTENGANDSMTILKDLNVTMAANENQNGFGNTSSFPDISRAFKSIDDAALMQNNDTEANNILTQSTYFEESQPSITSAKTNDDIDNLTKNCMIINDNFANKPINNLVANYVTDETQKFKITDSKIVAKMAKNINKKSDNESRQNKTNVLEQPTHKNDSKLKTIAVFNNNMANEELNPAKIIHNHIQGANISQDNTITSVHHNEKMASNVAKNVNKDLPNIDLQAAHFDSQVTELYSLEGFTQNFTHISQSQLSNVEVAEHFLYNSRNKLNDDFRNDMNVERYNMSKRNNNDTDELLVDTVAFNQNEMVNTNRSQLEDDTQNLNTQTHEVQYFKDKNGQMYQVLNTTDNEYINIHGIVKNDKTNTNIEEKHIKNDNLAIQPLNKATTHSKNVCVVENLQDSEDEITNSQVEVIPFKIVEEMNKVKMFLNKNMDRNLSADGYSTDSGYRSDSQRSSYRIAPHTSSNWLNQSSHCLYSYIIECPLLPTTQDIVKEISQILGRLIDRLHEEEKYPSFLEDVLENVDALIREVYESGSCESVLLKKDEKIQRLFLLNKSMHIQKYSIEKITHILENVHSYFTSQEELYELTNIEESENICYIFHILEVILQRYIKVKHMSQATESSQDEDTILKKSSITDIWRKKWIPNYKECVKFEGSSQKTCVLEKCAGILNKIVVDCMDGYSLVSFAALQCFNLLQA